MRGLVVGLLALVAAACSGGGTGVARAEAEKQQGALQASSPAGPREIDGCDLLSVEEVSAALGGQPNPGEAYGVVDARGRPGPVLVFRFSSSQDRPSLRRPAMVRSSSSPDARRRSPALATTDHAL